MFNGNEASWRRWKEIFDVLGVEAKGAGESIETQVLEITNLEDMVKLRALGELCSREYFDDASLLVVAWRRIMEVLETEEKGGGKKGEKEEGDSKELEILDACKALGQACGFVGDFDDARRYYKRAMEGYEEQLGRDSEKALDATYFLIMGTVMSDVEKIEKLRDLAKKMERALGEENVVTLETLNYLGGKLRDNGEYEEAIKIFERYLAGRMKVLGEDHKHTLMAVNNLGNVYNVSLKNYEKALECYERALKGQEKTLRNNHPLTLSTVMNIAIVYKIGIKDYGKAEEMYQKALDGKVAQLGKENESTKNSAMNIAVCFAQAGEK
ncbi:hypothetical protein TL16_g05853 [Triparma laevis f. inornata]|uniref:Kinesin light chain n=1 Tax=Triparma laevis f. inornata TaxID=1714386 RepID=A0A9W7AJT0_9STRA|nr:hypothetical protein TL16_g05853 [Triparma laevis f. inornata]